MSSRSASRPVPRSQNSLGISLDNDAHVNASTGNNHILCDGSLWIQSTGLPNSISEESADLSVIGECTGKEESLFPEHGYIPKAYFEYAQRALSTLILAGTFMAGVEAQLLSLIFSAPDLLVRSVAIGFAVTALLSTAFAALYCAVTYIWLRQEWRHKPHHFEEWVAGSLGMMLIWCSVFLVTGVYSGFFAVVFFLFAAAPRTIAIFSAAIFGLSPFVSYPTLSQLTTTALRNPAICGIGPMFWGFYYWYGLYRGWLEWTPHEDGSLPRRRHVSSV